MKQFKMNSFNLIRKLWSFFLFLSLFQCLYIISFNCYNHWHVVCCRSSYLWIIVAWGYLCHCEICRIPKNLWTDKQTEKEVNAISFWFLAFMCDIIIMISRKSDVICVEHSIHTLHFVENVLVHRSYCMDI